MARGTSLQQLVRMVREEAGHSTSAALGQNSIDAIKHKIRRQQQVLWLENDWPHLRVEREILLQAGSRYYNFPTDLSMNHRIDEVSTFYLDEWRPVEHGISLAHYNELDPEADERRAPVEYWATYQDTQLEVWPLPEQNDVRLRFRGTRNLRPLIADTDVCDLDDNMIAMFVASELTAKQNQRDSDALLSQARNLLVRLKGSTSRTRSFRVGNQGYREQGGGDTSAAGRPRPLYGKPI